MAEGEKIIQINISDEMKSAYIDYSMSVLSAVHYLMYEMGCACAPSRALHARFGRVVEQPYKKSARIVGRFGEIPPPRRQLGVRHHGTWPSIGRCVTPWWMAKATLGPSMATTPRRCATPRRVFRVAEDMLSDLNKETVDFRPNFDESLKEPTVLPAKSRICL